MAESHEVLNPRNEHFGYIRVNMHVLMRICGRLDSGTWCLCGAYFSPEVDEKLCARYVGQCHFVIGVPTPYHRSVPQRKRAFELFWWSSGLWHGVVL